MAKKSILQEAIADAQAIREGAYKNASSVLMEHLQDNIKEFVDSQLDEETEMNEETVEEEAEMTQEADETVTEMEDFDLDMEEEDDEDDLDLDLGDEDEDEDGLTEADLDEVLEAALQEVEHGDLGEMEVVDPDKRADSRGLEDLDSREAGWEEKDVPHAEDWTVKEHKYRRKIAQLAKENLLYKKANSKLQEALADVRLFNHKVLYTSKLVQTEGLSPKVKNQIVKSMDAGRTLAEVKNTYSTWKTALGVMGESKQTKKSKSSLSEAVLGSPKQGKGISQVKDDHILSESADPFSVHRMQSLAGLIED